MGIAETVFQNPRRHFDFDFSKCGWLGHNGVVVLGGLARYVHYHNTISEKFIAGVLNTDAFTTAGVMFLVSTMKSAVFNFLLEHNFLSHFTSGNNGKGTDYPEGNYVGYREHNNMLDADKIAGHLAEHWLTSDKVKLSPLLKSEIVSRIFEIFMNAYGHGVSIQDIEKLGVYSCGHYDSKNKRLVISVLDFGPGIITNVLENQPSISESIAAMQWALTKGNSTKTDSIDEQMPRGLGFDLLHEFVRINQGELRIYSNDVSVKIAHDAGVRIENASTYMRGTLVSVSINCDGKSYRFSFEKPSPSKEYF